MSVDPSGEVAIEQPGGGRTCSGNQCLSTRISCASSTAKVGSVVTMFPKCSPQPFWSSQCRDACNRSCDRRTSTLSDPCAIEAVFGPNGDLVARRPLPCYCESDGSGERPGQPRDPIDETVAQCDIITGCCWLCECRHVVIATNSNGTCQSTSGLMAQASNVQTK